MVLNCLQYIGYAEAEVKTVVSDLEAKSLLTDKTACALQVIRSVSFDWSQCSIDCVASSSLGEQYRFRHFRGQPSVIFSDQAKVVWLFSRFLSIPSFTS